MKISVLIPSRGRPVALQFTIRALHERASGRHEVGYLVGWDADDPVTLQLIEHLAGQGIPVKGYRFDERRGSLGQMANDLSEAAPADVYCPMCDDLEMLTDHWDANVAEAWRLRPDGVWWWRTENNAACAIVSEKWRAAAGRIYTPYFPFWWDDCWLIQLWKFARGVPHMLGCGSWIKDRGLGTHRMRELKFWTDFYWSRRLERIHEARNIARRLGWPLIDDATLAALTSEPHPDFDPEKVEAQQGDTGAPTPEYVAIKQRAEALMQGG